jgi:ATP-grasp domain
MSEEDTVKPVDIFVVGLDESNLRSLERLPGAAGYRFHPLLSVPEIQQGEIPIAELLDKAQRELDSFDVVGGIVGYWDFPVTTIVPILCRRRGLPAPNLDGVIRCEHKYWSRLEQAKVIDEHPEFALVDLDEATEPPPNLSYPIWLKPVKSFSSELAFKVTDQDEFIAAVEKIRQGIGRVGKPFQWVLDHADGVELPPEIASHGALACLAEEAMSGVQAATEGFVHGNEVVVTGALDSIDYPDSSSFLRHQYPSQLPAEVVDRMAEVSRRVLRQLGLRNSMFSVEFFCDPESGDVCVLEVNARHSQSHAELFEYVDGVANHHSMVELALGRRPRLPVNEGRYRIAAKWYYRRFTDATVRRVPTEIELTELRREVPGTTVEIVPKPGQRLSALEAQDSYSYELAMVHVGADSEAELQDKYDRVVTGLHFDFDED